MNDKIPISKITAVNLVVITRIEDKAAMVMRQKPVTTSAIAGSGFDGPVITRKINTLKDIAIATKQIIVVMCRATSRYSSNFVILLPPLFLFQTCFLYHRLTVLFHQYA